MCSPCPLFAHLQEMPWLALPFDKRDAKAELSKMFQVR
jgi:hypothetical protein